VPEKDKIGPQYWEENVGERGGENVELIFSRGTGPEGEKRWQTLPSGVFESLMSICICYQRWNEARASRNRRKEKGVQSKF